MTVQAKVETVGSRLQMDRRRLREIATELTELERERGRLLAVAYEGDSPDRERLARIDADLQALRGERETIEARLPAGGDRLAELEVDLRQEQTEVAREAWRAAEIANLEANLALLDTFAELQVARRDVAETHEVLVEAARRYGGLRGEAVNAGFFFVGPDEEKRKQIVKALQQRGFEI